MKMFGIYVVFIAFLSTCAARAATYNFYFNNNEQGDNSTSTPTVVVKGGETTKTGDEAEDAAVAPQPTEDLKIPNSRLVTPSEQTTQIQSQPKSFVQFSDPEKKRFHHFRLATDVFSGQAQTRRDTYSWPNEYYYPESSKKSGLILSADFFFNKWVGAGMFLGGLNGAQAEFTPIHIGARNTFEIGGMMGWMATGFLYGENAVFAGARASFNINDYFGLNFAFRTTPFKDDSLNYTGFETGVHVKL